MGYESMVFVVERKEIQPLNGMPMWVHGDEIARFDLCKMGWEQIGGKSFSGVFDEPIDFDLYVDRDTAERVDCYGDECKMTSVERVMFWLENSEVLKEYRRAQLFYDFLKALRAREQDFGSGLVLVHYGY